MLLLPVLNVVLNFAIIQGRKRLFVLPLRHALLVYLLAKPYIALGTL